MDEKNFLYSQAKKLQDIEFYKREFVFHLCCGNYQLSLLFSKMIASENVDIKELLEKMLKMDLPPIEQLFVKKNSGNNIQNFFRNQFQKINLSNKTNYKNQNTLLYYYLLYYIEYYYDPNIKKIDYTKFFLNTFLTEFSDPKKSIKIGNTNNVNWAEQLYRYLTSSLDIPQNQFQLILKGLLTFATQDKALYYSLRPQAASVLARIGAQNYIPILEFNIFDVLPSIDPSILILFPPNLINSSNFDKFLQYPTVLFNSQFINLALNLIGSTEPFPLGSSLFQESNLLTLINHTIMKRKHFVDIILSFAHNTLMSHDFNNVEIILDVLSDAPHSELKPWLMLTDFNDLYPDQEFLMSVIPLYIDKASKISSPDENENELINLNISNNKSLSMLKRLKNDNILLTYINQAIGICITLNELPKETLPNYLSGIMRNINFNDFEHFSKLEYFVMSDHDRNMDFDFIFLYLIYSSILNSFKNRKSPEGENEKLDSDKIDNCLKNVRNINKNILIDIFSLLFIQDRVTHEFLADIEDAETILSVLVQYSHDFIKNDKDSSGDADLSKIVLGFAKIQQFYVLNSKLSISDCFVSSLDTILSALEKHDYEIAKRFASQSNMTNLLRLIQFSETIYSYVKSGRKEEIITNFVNGIQPKELVSKFLIELAMSTNDKINEISTDSVEIENLRSIIQSRQKLKNGNSPLSCIGSSEFLKDVLDEAKLRMFFGGNEVYVDWSDNEDDGNQLISPDTFPVLGDFIEHYELFIRISISQSENKSSIAMNNSEQSLDFILNSIIQSDKIDNWETFTHLVGSNALEMIILHCDLSKASEKIASLIQEQMPVIGELIRLQKKYNSIYSSDFIKKNESLPKNAIDKIVKIVGDRNKGLIDVLNNQETKEKNSSLELLSKFLSDYSNTDKAALILLLFKLINESYPNKHGSSDDLSSSFFFTSDNLLSFIDVIDEILFAESNSDKIMKKISSLLIDELLNFFNSNQLYKFIHFPVEFISELRAKTVLDANSELDLFSYPSSSSAGNESIFDIFLPNFASDRKKNIKLSLIDLSIIFPEKINKEILFLINHKITSSDPKNIIKSFIEKRHIFYAEKFSKDNSSLHSIFIDELLNYVTSSMNDIIFNSNNNDKVDKNEVIQQEMTKLVLSLFSSNIKLSKTIYSKLPKKLIKSYVQITNAFEALTLPAADRDGFYDQSKNSFRYSDFNEEIKNLLNENLALDSIQTVVDYALNIYLNPDDINELDDEYSTFMKKQNLNLNEEQKKLFIQDVQSVLHLTIKTNYSTVNTVKDEQIVFKALRISDSIIKKILFAFNYDSPFSMRSNKNSNFSCYSGSLQFLLDFVREEYNLRFGEKYSLSNVDDLIQICIKYDNFDLIKEQFLITFLSKGSSNVSLQRTSSFMLFISSIQKYFVKISKNLLLLNQTNEYNKVLDFLLNIRNKFACDSVCDISELLRILSHPNFFEVNFNKEIIHVEVSPLYYRVRMIIDGNMALTNKEFFKLTDKTIVCFNGEKELLKFHNKYGNFETFIKEIRPTEVKAENVSLISQSSFSALEELVKNKDFLEVVQSASSENAEKTEVFDALQSLHTAIDYIIFPSLSLDHWNGLWRFFVRNLSSSNKEISSKIKVIIDEFIEFVKSKNMMFILFDIQNRLQMREDAILAASEIFHGLCTWSDRAIYSNMLKELCENEIKSRKNEGKKPEKVSDGVLSSIYKKSSIYSEFCQFCHDTKTNFDKNLDIFSKGIVIPSSNSNNNYLEDEKDSKNHVIDMMAFLAFVKKNFVLGLKIAGLKPSCSESVIRNTVETIFCAGNNEIKSFMSELKKQLYVNPEGQNTDYDTISIIAVECIEKKVSQKSVMISRFITDYVCGSPLQVALLVKYGFPRDALKCCNNDKHNIKIVYECALQKKDSKLTRECKKLLSLCEKDK